MPAIIFPEKFSAGFINRVFFNREWKNDWLSDINTGRCYDWAYIAYCLWPEVLLWTTDHHAWVQVDNKFFDSEAQYGLQNHEWLNCNSMWPGDEVEPTIMNVQDFKNLWNTFGGGKRFHWDSLVEKIRQLGLNPIRS